MTPSLNVLLHRGFIRETTLLMKVPKDVSQNVCFPSPHDPFHVAEPPDGLPSVPPHNWCTLL
jgi:hypothetical protein